MTRTFSPTPADIQRDWVVIDATDVILGRLASHAAVADKATEPFQVHRWRCNIFLDGLAAWEEFDWVGRTIRIGEAEAKVETRLDRCMATTVNTDTGIRNVPTLEILKGFGHQDFAVALVVTKGGRLRIGDEVTPL